MDGLRRRKLVEDVIQEKDVGQKIASFDVFPKLPADMKRQTTFGAFLTILCSGAVLLMVITEYFHYLEPNLEFTYSVDDDFTSKLSLSLDMTVAMPCEAIGCDIVDLVNDNVDVDGGLHEEPAYFQLSETEEHTFLVKRSLNKYVAEEYHALHKLIWRTGYKSSDSVPRSKNFKLHPTKNPDACRFYGQVNVNKMAGNLHVLSGKALHAANIHAHISLFTVETDQNFSHRIDRLSFGSSDVSILNPLDGELQITDKHSVSYQYTVKVVPTFVHTRAAGSVMTYQYGVQATQRVLNHSSGSHGTPGIFIKYDINPLRINVIESPVPILHFLVRVCGIVGGVFATTGIVCSLLGMVYSKIFGRQSEAKIPLYRQESEKSQPSPSQPSSPSVDLPNNALFSNLTTAEQLLNIR